MKSILFRRAALAAVALLASADSAAASADSAQYKGCDGYGAASLEGDGMTSYATVLLIFNPPNWGNTGQSAAQAGAAGVADCDAALSDLSARHWMRKVSLLRARAFHKLEASDITGALADLDLAADAAHDDDAFYARSLGLGLKLTRAYALRLSGDQAKADALIAEALHDRPYNRQVNIDALLAGGAGGDSSIFRTSAQNLHRLVPSSAKSLLDQSFSHSLFADVVALHGLLGTAAHGGLRDPVNFVRGEGMYAYALAALGRNDEARAAIAAARARLADTGAPAPETSAPDDGEATQTSNHPRGATDAHAGESMLHAWEIMVEWRIHVSEGGAVEVLKALQKSHLPPGPMSVDLVTALAAALPEKLKPSVPPVEPLRADTHIPPNEETSLLRLFFKNLPGPETSSNIPSLSEKGWLDIHGASVSQEGGFTKVTFRGAEGTPSVMEEMTLLKAAELARDAGKKGIVVVQRGDVQYTVTSTYYGIPMRTDPDGFSTDLSVVFVDPAALPDEYKATPWRVIDVDDVLQRLEPIYRPSRKH